MRPPRSAGFSASSARGPRSASWKTTDTSSRSTNHAVPRAESVPKARAPAPPTIVHKRPIYDQGLRVGELHIVRSILPLVRQTGLAALLGLLLGGGVFVAFRVLPMRALMRATQALGREVEEHEKARREA